MLVALTNGKTTDYPWAGIASGATTQLPAICSDLACYNIEALYFTQVTAGIMIQVAVAVKGAASTRVETDPSGYTKDRTVANVVSFTGSDIAQVSVIPGAGSTACALSNGLGYKLAALETAGTD